VIGRIGLNQEWNIGSAVHTRSIVGEHVSTRNGTEEWSGRTCLNQEWNGGVERENMSQPGMEQRSGVYKGTGYGAAEIPHSSI
jgi:hypothetical protein